MLTIRAEQMAVFTDASDAVLRDRIIVHLRERHRDAISDVPESILQNRVMAGIHCGHSLGLTWASSLIAFVTLMFVIGPRFHKHPEIQNALSGDDARSDERMAALQETVPDSAWDEAAKLSTELDWEYELQKDVT